MYNTPIMGHFHSALGWKCSAPALPHDPPHKGTQKGIWGTWSPPLSLHWVTSILGSRQTLIPGSVSQTGFALAVPGNVGTHSWIAQQSHGPIHGSAWGEEEGAPVFLGCPSHSHCTKEQCQAGNQHIHTSIPDAPATPAAPT